MIELAINGGSPVIDKVRAAFEWPIITKDVESAILRQLHATVSIYDDSGIFGVFEKKFAKYHNREYGLLFSSGTVAILSMFEAIGLGAGDEVIAPVYTFHATASPMINLGCVPVFADCDDQGNISLESLKEKCTSKTRAVIVTHMWGVPVRDIEKISEYCKQEGLYLLEDCSHAHGASINGRPVGSFGDMAAWSLQGQKIITGGEGGIVLTDSKTLFNRSLLYGHYNKRPRKNLSPKDPLYKFYLTGFGLKLRAHPLAIAMANQQFDMIGEFIVHKARYADRIINAISQFDFIKYVCKTDYTKPSWYALGFHFVEDKAFGVTKDEFVEALHAEGLIEFDVPGSTGLINDLPLFNTPNEVFPGLYSEPLAKQNGFPVAEKFFETFIKLPIWARAEDESVVSAYVEGFNKVASYLQDNKTLSSVSRKKA